MSNEKKIQQASEIFAINVFDLEKMERALPQEAYEKLINAIESNEKLDIPTANIAATAMRDWAISRNCTHYTHWFQPMTGYTAEKHDSFISHSKSGEVIESFSGKQLIQGEPDASSFPSGGIRSTFEARGYTIWDPTSPAFVIEYPHGNTLCIPSIFISYTGEILDKKAPLLRSVEALNKAALDILKLFKSPAKKVFSTLGSEQEFFLIQRKFYESRPDIIQTGRTLFGNPPGKHQQLEDQYFGNICEKAFEFMTNVETEAYKLGIPLKTRHNEVAPNQFELAPIFEEANVAVDHNQILMDLMDRIAKRMDLACLFHEKPFAGVNGSGKHNNWSMSTDKNENLLEPGNTPQSNLQFLVFLVCAIKAVYDHSKELRISIASAGNDHRLGANEAPPAIISVFLGELLTRVLNDLEKGKITETTEKAWLSIGIDKIPTIPRDNTDRNRTSPFAFTGNKFEFRAVGSNQTPSTAITVLNSAMAAALIEAKEAIDKKMKNGSDFNSAAVDTIREMYSASKKVCFEGDNYSKEWEKEAEKRGLPNFKKTPDALAAIIEKNTIELFEKTKVYNKRELESRYIINMHNYTKQIDIEARVFYSMAMTRFLPAAIEYLNTLLTNIQLSESVLGKEKSKEIKDLALTITDFCNKLKIESENIETARIKAENISDIKKSGEAYKNLLNETQKIRDIVDMLETLIPHSLWPVPKYREMLLQL